MANITTPLLLMVLIGWSTATAQPSAVRLSSEGYGYRLFESERIQDAASIGAWQLVVWGTRTAIDDGRIRSALAAAWIHDGSVIGEPFVICDTVARPTDVVKVVPTVRGVLVVWNDSRAREPGIYACELDTGGTPKSERRISATQIMNQRLLRFGDPAGGQLLVWLAHDGSLQWPLVSVRSIRFDDVGGFDNERVLADTVFTTVSIEFIASDSTGRSGLLRVGDSTAFLVAPGMHLGLNRIVGGWVSGSVFLRADGSLVRYFDGRLELYRSTASSAADSAVDVTIAAIPRTIVVTARGDTAFLHWLELVHPDSTVTVLRLHRTRVDRFETIHEDEVIDSAMFTVAKYRPSDYRQWEQVTTSAYHGCSGAIAISATYECSWFSSYTNSGRRFALPVHFVLDAASVSELQLGAAIDTCREPWNVEVERRRFDTVSSVVVDDGIEVKVPIPREAIVVAQESPGIVLSDGTILVTWMQPNDPLLFRVGELERAPLRYRPIDSMRPPRLEFGRGRGLIYSNVRFAIVNQFGGSVAVCIQDRADSFYTSHGIPAYYSMSASFYKPSPNGWYLAWGPWFETDLQPRVGEWTVGIDPATGAFFGGADFFCATFGQIVPWSGRPSGTNFGGWFDWSLLTPLFDTSLLVCDARHAYRRGPYDSEIVVTFDSAAPNARFFKLLGDMFLRVYRGRLPGYSVLELYSVGRTLLSRVELRMNASEQGWSVAMNPRDSSIALVYRATDGRLRGSVFDSRLWPRAIDTLLAPGARFPRASATLFVGDTLFVTWEDASSGAPDIYATSIDIATMVRMSTVERDNRPQDAVDDAIPGLRLQSMFPNPANDHVTIEANGVQAAATVEVIDFIGRVARRASIERRGRLTLDVNNLATGSYLVVLRCGASVDVKRLDVVHY